MKHFDDESRDAEGRYLPDGTIGVLQAFPGKIIKLNLDNTSAGAWPVGDPTQGFGVPAAGALATLSLVAALCAGVLGAWWLWPSGATPSPRLTPSASASNWLWLPR